MLLLAHTSSGFPLTACLSSKARKIDLFPVYSNFPQQFIVVCSFETLCRRQAECQCYCLCARGANKKEQAETVDTICLPLILLQINCCFHFSAMCQVKRRRRAKT